jgi:hypothetical protein
MLPVSFEPLANAEPEYRETFHVLDRWVERHRDWRWIVPGIVARDNPLLDAFELTNALQLAVRAGILRLQYTVLTPSGVLASDAYDDPRQIPAELPDRQENFFDTRDYPLVPVYFPSRTAGL